MASLPQTLTHTQQVIVNALLYFDVFNYPLKHLEILENCSIKLTLNEFNVQLQQLLDMDVIKQQNGFYFVGDVNQLHITNRIKANALAIQKLQTSYQCSKVISNFPFVKGVCISGGLSKNYYDENSDTDYFIITKANRLWLCRTLFILYYKTLSKTKREYFCLNYYISESDLNIPDQNAFVATELAYLIPTINYTVYQEVLNRNSWYKLYLPNKSLYSSTNCLSEQRPILKKTIERLLNNKLGDWFDDVLFKKTLNHWRKKHRDLTIDEFNLQVRSKKNVCKHHLKGHQNKVLIRWQEKMDAFLNTKDTLKQTKKIKN